MLSDVYISGVSFGEETPNNGNINTLEVLILNPNDFFISVDSERGSVTHSRSRDTDIDGGLRTAGSDEHNYSVAAAVQRRWACHTRTVLPADAYGRQRCNVGLSARSNVYLWYMSCGLCPRERGQQNQTSFTGTYVQNRPHTEKPGKSSYPPPAEKKL